MNLDVFTFDAGECAAVTLKVRRVDGAVVWIYVRPGTTWYPREVIEVRRPCAEIVFLRGESKAQYE